MTDKILEEGKVILEDIKKMKDLITSDSSFTASEKEVILTAYIKNRFGTQNGLSNGIPTPVTSAPTNGQNFTGQGLTFVGCMKKTKFSSHPDIVLLATYYITQVSKEKEFVNIEDIENMYGKALLKKSSNTSQMINENRKKDFMMEHEKLNGKMTYKMTMSGIEYIEEKLHNGN